MNVLPDRIVALDNELGATKNYRRLNPDDIEKVFGRKLHEKDYDDLIVKHVDLLAETLRQAEVIDEDSELLVLGTQIKAIDVLMAEIETTTREFRRLVLVEDKLFMNPQARREVLAQIFDYAYLVENDLDADTLREYVTETESWILHNRNRIDASMSSGDYLLVICGDYIQERLLRLVDHFVEHTNNNPLSRTDLCLVSMAIYSDGSTQLLVPNVVNAVVGAKRELTIRVQVENVKGEALEASVEVAEPSSINRTFSPTAGSRSEEEFFAEYKINHGEPAVISCKTILTALRESGIPGLLLTNTAMGRPSVYLKNTPLGVIDICMVSKKEPSFHDNLPSLLNRYRGDPDVAQAVDHFRQLLCGMGGFLPQKKGLVPRVHVPIVALASNTQGFIDALKQFLAALKSSRADSQSGF